MNQIFEIQTKRKFYILWKGIFQASLKLSWISVTIIGIVLLSTFTALISSDQSPLQAEYSIQIFKYAFIGMVTTIMGHASLLCLRNILGEDLFISSYAQWFEKIRSNRPWAEIIPIVLTQLALTIFLTAGLMYQVVVYGFAGYLFVSNFQHIRKDLVCESELRQKLNNQLYRVSEECNEIVNVRIDVSTE